MAKSPVRAAVDAVLAKHRVYVGTKPTITDTARDNEQVVTGFRIKYPRVKCLNYEVAIEILQTMYVIKVVRGFKYVYVTMSNPKHGDCHGLVVGATNNPITIERIRQSNPVLINDLDSTGGVIIRDGDGTAVVPMDPAYTRKMMLEFPKHLVHPVWEATAPDAPKMITIEDHNAKMEKYHLEREQREATSKSNKAQQILDVVYNDLKTNLEAALEKYRGLAQLSTKAGELQLPPDGDVRKAIEADITKLTLKWEAVGVELWMML